MRLHYPVPRRCAAPSGYSTAARGPCDRPEVFRRHPDLPAAAASPFRAVARRPTVHFVVHAC